jgi:hypothetical protein
MSEFKQYTILTEEAPSIYDIKFIIEKVFKLDLDTICNNDLKIVSIGNKFTGKWKLEIDNYIFNIQLFKGVTSCVDYIVFDGKIDLNNESGENAMCILESTKTCDKESRNTSVYQRLTKFTTYFKMFPKSKALQFMLYNANWNSSTITETAKLGFRIMKTLGINVYCGTHTYINLLDKYNIKEFINLDEIITSKNSIRQKKGNTSVQILIKNYIKDKKIIKNIYISCKLDKGNGASKGKMSHDPNIGLLSGLVNCINKFSNDDIIVTEHGLDQTYFDKTRKSKFWHSVYSINLDFHDVIVKSYPTLPKKYFMIEDNMTEKLSTILFDYLNPEETIFSNHSGCALTNLKTISGSINIEKTMPRPDIVFFNKENKTITIVEGKIEKEIKQGIKQLEEDNLKRFIKLINTHYPAYNINRGLCITIDSITNIKKYIELKYPILFALDKEGNYIIN